MLVRILQLNYKDDADLYEDAKYLAGYNEPNYAEFVRMLKQLKDDGEEFQISVGEDWYMIDTYVFNCSANSEILPCINVYVM